MRMDSVNHTVSYADQLAMNLGDPDKADQAFRQKVLRKMPDRFLKHLGRRYQEVFTTHGRRDANLMLLEANKKLTSETIRLSSSNDDLILFAKRRSEACSKIYVRSPSLNDAYSSISTVVRRFNLEPINVGGKYDLYGAVVRMIDERWWRRTIRRTHGRNCEALAIEWGLVRKQAGLYASDDALKRRMEQKTRTTQMLEEMEAVNELGDSYTLKELQDLSVSNPAIRRAELMTRIAGFEQYALKYGHVGEFLTITCPSRMHARWSNSGQPNTKYDGTTPEQAQEYLSGQWCKARSALKRANIDLYGMRVAEPQHDGTPHWHMLFFMAPEHVETVRKIIRHYALEHDENEKGASKHRFTAIAIDWSKGTAAGYIAKYISKNIDAHGVDEDLFGNDAKKSSLRVDAWASTWGTRQFQQVGGPPVTTWRVLRKLSEVPEDGIANLAYQAADQGNWCQYMEIMGGHTALRKDWPIGLAKEEIDALNSYGEPIGQVIVGINVGQITYRSKVHVWEIRSKNSGQKFDQDELVNRGLLTYRSKFGQNVTFKEGDLIYSSEPGHNVTLRDQVPLRNVNVTGDFEEIPYVNDPPLEFCQ